MVTKDFPIFDCDSHVVEPPEIWDEYVPSAIRSWVKTQFHFHTDTDVLHINGRVVPATRERSNAAEVGWPRWSKKEVGALVPGTEEWKRKFGRLAGCREPQARLRDMDALGTDQVMLFPTWFVRLALVKDPEAAGALARAYNDWVYDYCAANRQRLFPAPSSPSRASSNRSRSFGGWPSGASRLRPFGPVSGTGVIRRCRSSILSGESSKTWTWCSHAHLSLAGGPHPGGGADRANPGQRRRTALHGRGGRLFTRAVSEQYRVQYGAHHRQLRSARLHLRSHDLAHGRADDGVARQVPASAGSRARVQCHPAAAGAQPEPELP